MYRTVFTPTENNTVIPFTVPREWYGKMLEVIVFPVSTAIHSSQKSDDSEFFNLAGAWDSGKSADEMLADWKAARTFGDKEALF
jgi:hypothetical protein